MIPFIGYSQAITLKKNLTKYQLQSILRDRAALDYYIRINELNDSLSVLQEDKIYSLQQEIVQYKSIEQKGIINTEFYKNKYESERRKNKFIKIVSGSIITGLVVLYIVK